MTIEEEANSMVLVQVNIAAVGAKVAVVVRAADVEESEENVKGISTRKMMTTIFVELCMT